MKRAPAFSSASRVRRRALLGAVWVLALGLVACGTSGDSASGPAVPAPIPLTAPDGHISLRARFVYVVIPGFRPQVREGGIAGQLDLPERYDKRRTYEAILARHPDARIYHSATLDVKSATGEWRGELYRSTPAGPVATGIPFSARISRWSHCLGLNAVSAQFSLTGVVFPAGEPEAARRMPDTSPATLDETIATTLLFAGAPVWCGSQAVVEGHEDVVYCFAEMVPVDSARVSVATRRHDGAGAIVGAGGPTPPVSPAAPAPAPAEPGLWLQYERYRQFHLTRAQAQGIVAAARLPGREWMAALPPTPYAQPSVRFYTGPIGLVGTRRQTVVVHVEGLPEHFDVSCDGADATPAVSVTPWETLQVPPAQPADAVKLAAGESLLVATPARIFAAVHNVRPTEIPSVFYDARTGYYVVNLVRISRVEPAPVATSAESAPPAAP